MTGAGASKRNPLVAGNSFDPRLARRFGAVCVLAYVALSWGIRFDMRRGEHMASLIYPLDTFSMYAPVPGEDVHHLLIRDAKGEVHSIWGYRSFECGEPIRGGIARCAEQIGIEYHRDDLLHHIERHPGGGDESVELISRGWRIRMGEKPVQTGDCVIAHCRVGR